jgi:hypothetical protein
LELGAVDLDDRIRVAVLPDPVGPRKSIVPTGRFIGFMPAKKIWNRPDMRRTARSCPTMREDKFFSNSSARGLF